MNNEIKVHDDIAVVKIPFKKENGEYEVNKVYAHIIEYKGRLFTHHGNGDSGSPLSIITHTFSDFETGHKIKSIELYLFQLAPYHNKKQTQQHITELFETFVKPIIDHHENKYDEAKKDKKILNKEIVYEQGKMQSLLNECN